MKKEPVFSSDPNATRLHIFSFVVKIFVEDEVALNRKKKLEGIITHVPSGERKHFRDLGDIVDFIDVYIDDAVDDKPAGPAHRKD
ncbi:MAG: hypothetical protein AB1894_02990 [Chloroflexota bacterium]